MKNIYLIRHGQTVSNAGGKAQRNPEIPLTPLGEQQAKDVADWVLAHLGKLDSIGVSPFIRTHQTAAPLVATTGIQPTVIEGLQEFNYLSFDHIADLPATSRRAMAHDYWASKSPDDVDGGERGDAESFNAFNARIDKVIDTFSEMPDGNHVVYAHGLWLSMLLWRLLSLPMNDADTMRRFRQFEQAISIKNSEIFLLQFNGSVMPAISKIREII